MTDDLLDIRNRLQSRDDLTVDLRGSGKATFLYVRSLKRSAEVSVEGEEFFIEYWDSVDEHSDEAPVKGETVRSASGATKKLAEWL